MLSDQAATLWGEVGRQLAAEKGLVVITGGLASRKDAPGGMTADLAMATGYETELLAQGIDPIDRIETCYPYPTLEWQNLERFSKGRLRILTNRNAQSRRFRMVFDADVVISIEGSAGTRSILDVALAIDRPVFPVPCGGKASLDAWNADKTEICKTFRLSPEEIQTLGNTKLGSLEPEAIRALAHTVCECVLRGFTPQCFVIMPFHEEFNPVYEQAIEPALTRFGLKPVRTDKDIAAGNLVEAIRFGIQHCYFAVADTTHDRHNVMYELGMAHALAKQVILLRRKGEEKNEQPPFDLRTESVIFYEPDNLKQLKAEIEAAVQKITGRAPGEEPPALEGESEIAKEKQF
jgi:hypothetical protein